MSKAITKPVAGLTLFALVAMACPAPTKAQVANPDRPVPAAPSLPAARPVQPSPAPANNAMPAPSQAPVNNSAPTPGAMPNNNPAPQTPITSPAAAATEDPLPVQVQADYVLGGGDRVRISVFEVPEYTGEYQIPPGGDLYLPLIGRVELYGLTQDEAAEVVAQKYARFLKRPLVTVSLISTRPINVVVAGEVNRPGTFTLALQGGAGDNPGVQYPTVIGAITQAQGVTLAADLRKVQVRRLRGWPNKSDQIITLDLTQLVRTGSRQDVPLRDGDTIFVATASEPNMAEIRQFASASFAEDPTRPRSVTVVGEVNRPGSYVVIGGGTAAAAATTPGNTQGGAGGTIDSGGGAGGGLPTISRAIQLAGGITDMADVRNIQIRRPTKSGTEQKITVNFWKLLQGDSNQDTLVQEGDTIVVSTATNISPADATTLADASFSPAIIQVSVVGEVKNPGLVSLQPNTPLNQAILTAGGFSDGRASRGSVDMIRLNPDGTVTKRKLDMDFSRGINEENNPILRNSDVVVVRRNAAAKVGDGIGTIFGPIIAPILGLVGFF